MPKEAILRVTAFGHQQRMPLTLTFGNCVGADIGDTLDDVAQWSDNDSNYDPADEDNSFASNNLQNTEVNDAKDDDYGNSNNGNDDDDDNDNDDDHSNGNDGGDYGNDSDYTGEGAYDGGDDGNSIDDDDGNEGVEADHDDDCGLDKTSVADNEEDARLADDFEADLDALENKLNDENTDRDGVETI